jgi:hypothetical protein
LRSIALNAWNRLRLKRMGRRGPQQVYTYPGNIHIHSTYSDGSGDIGQIAAAASDGRSSAILLLQTMKPWRAFLKKVLTRVLLF